MERAIDGFEAKTRDGLRYWVLRRQGFIKVRLNALPAPTRVSQVGLPGVKRGAVRVD